MMHKEVKTRLLMFLHMHATCTLWPGYKIAESPDTSCLLMPFSALMNIPFRL
jgi:hypothetical protein